jgi:hypothetical protein
MSSLNRTNDHSFLSENWYVTWLLQYSLTPNKNGGSFRAVPTWTSLSMWHKWNVMTIDGSSAVNVDTVRGYQLSEEHTGSIFRVILTSCKGGGHWDTREAVRMWSPVRSNGNESHWLSSLPLRWVWVTTFLTTLLHNRTYPSRYILQPWSWKNHVPPKCRWPSTKLYGIISQETTIWSGKGHSSFELIDIVNTRIFFAILHIHTGNLGLLQIQGTPSVLTAVLRNIP